MTTIQRPLRGNAPGATFWLRWAQIVNQGTDTSFLPFLGSDEELREYLGDFEGADKEIHVLDRIQQSSIAYFNPPTLQILLNSLVDALPQVIQDKVGLHMGADYPDPDTGPVIGQPSWFSQDDGRFRLTLDLFARDILPSLDSGNKEFVLWVVDAGTSRNPYYVTIVLCYRASDILRPDVFDRITHWAIIDARDVEQRSEAAERTANRLVNLLPDHAEDAIRHYVWLPPYQDGQGEDFASGLIAYSVVVQLLDRIGTMSCGEFDVEAIFAPLRPWFNPDAARAEALGRAAMKAMEKLNWKCRLGLFPIQPSSNDQARLGNAQALPIAHTLPRPAADDAISKFGSLFSDDDDEDQKIPAGHGTQPDSPEVPKAEDSPISIKFPSNSPISSPSSSPSSDPSQGPSPSPSPEAGDDELAIFLFRIYYARKRQDLIRARNEADDTYDMCMEALTFAERIQNEVFEAPGRNIPTVYAIERLFWLRQRAAEATLHTRQLRNWLDRRYTTGPIHDAAAQQLRLEPAWEELDELYQAFDYIYEITQLVLDRAYEARRGFAPWDDLGEAARENDFEDFEDIEDILGGGGNDDAAGDNDDDNDEDDENDEDNDEDAVSSLGRPEASSTPTPPRPHPSTPQKRKYTNAATSTIDEDGQEVFTIEISADMRSWDSRGKKKAAKKPKR
ncbi:hypothetical protein F5Y01DRAFT_306313 [Xylaria sp. FL0043]|nr:hypothetical protein F5Y01DRAFT_306313 [Xylaria sp. FL0043]